MTTWRLLIADELETFGETFNDVLRCTLSEEELDIEFDNGFGAAEGLPFTLWTSERVYFPKEYDGAENVECVLRNPCHHKTQHI